MCSYIVKFKASRESKGLDTTRDFGLLHSELLLQSFEAVANISISRSQFKQLYRVQKALYDAKCKELP